MKLIDKIHVITTSQFDKITSYVTLNAPIQSKFNNIKYLQRWLKQDSIIHYTQILSLRYRELRNHSCDMSLHRYVHIYIHMYKSISFILFFITNSFFLQTILLRNIYNIFINNLVKHLSICQNNVLRLTAKSWIILIAIWTHAYYKWLTCFTFNRIATGYISKRPPYWTSMFCVLLFIEKQYLKLPEYLYLNMNHGILVHWEDDILQII